MKDIDLVKRKPDGGLSERIEFLEMIGDSSDAELLCLLLELRRHREDKSALIERFSRQRLEFMIYTHHAQCGDVAALEQQDAPGKIYQIRKLDGSEEWQQWYEVSADEYHAGVSSEGWERRILIGLQGGCDGYISRRT